MRDTRERPARRGKRFSSMGLMMKSNGAYRYMLTFSATLVVPLVVLIGCHEQEPEPSLGYARDDTHPTNASHTEAQSLKSVRALLICRDQPLLREDAIAWQKMLKQHEIEALIVSKERLAASALSGIDLIIVGTGRIDRIRYVSTNVSEGVYRDTAIRPDPELGPDSWEESKVVKILSESGLPIIGIGENGYSLFHKLGFPTNTSLRSYSRGKTSTFKFAENSTEYLGSPFKIEEGQLAFTNKEEDVASHYFPPPSMECILEDVNKPGYYPLARYQQYVSWYCGRDAQELSESGKKLFANIAYALVEDKRERSDADRMAALQEQNYNNALEYYNLFCIRKLSLRDIEAKVESGCFSEEELRLYVRARRLREFEGDWSVETPDAVISKEDREYVDEIISQLFPDPAIRKRWENISTRFYGRNRCSVSILHYDKGPLDSSGSYLFLIKYKGKWEALSKGGWIS